MFCFSEIVLFQFCFSVFTCETKLWNKTKVGVAYLSIKNFAQWGMKLSKHLRHMWRNAVTTWRTNHYLTFKWSKILLTQAYHCRYSVGCWLVPMLPFVRRHCCKINRLLFQSAGSLCHILIKMSIWSSEKLFAIFTVVILHNVINDIIDGGAYTWILIN